MASFRHFLVAVVLMPTCVIAVETRTCLVVGVSDGDAITACCGEPGA